MSLPATAPSTTQKMRALAYFVDVPDNHKDEAIFNAAVMLAEARKQAPVTTNNTADECLSVVASYFPPAGQATAPSAELRATLQEILLIFVPRGVQPLPIAPQGTAPPGSVIQVNTAEAAERAEKSIIVGGVKMPRKSETPYSCFYPHSFLPLFLDADSPTAAAQPAYLAWERQMDQILGSKIPEIHFFKLKRMKKVAEMWFISLAHLKTATIPLLPSVITETMSRLWFANIEQMLELHLITTELCTSASMATKTFHAAVDAKWHNSETLDYFSAITLAKNEKKTDQRPKGSFRN